MRRLVCVVAALIGLPLAAQATGYEDTTRAKFTLGRMFTQAGTFGLPPYATDPFACTASVSSERTMYYNTTFHSVVYCNGSSWTTLGTSSGLSSPVAGDYVWTGKQTFGGGVDGANSVRVGETSGAIVFEGSSADAFETTLGVTDPTADVRFNLPNATAGTYSILTDSAAGTANTVPVASGTAWVSTSVPNCTDTGGNHINFTTATGLFSCGTSGGGGLVSPIAGDYVWTGKQTYGTAADAANSVRLGETAGAIVFEGSSADAFETTLTAANPGAAVTATIPATTGTLATLGAVDQTFTNKITSPNVIGSTTLQAIGTGSANGITLGSTGIVFEGATAGADTFKTTLSVVDPTASATYQLPNATAGTYSILTSAAAVSLAQGGTGLGSAADDTTLVSTGSAWQAKALPACTDTGGNHLNYDQASNAFSCGTSSGSSGSSFLDGAFSIKNTADNTKIATFDASGIGTGTSKSFALPNVAGTIVTTAGTTASNGIILGTSVAWNTGFAAGIMFNNSATPSWDYGGLAGQNAVGTPPGAMLMTGKSPLSNSVVVKTGTAISTDVHNGPCGTSTCTDPTLILVSHNANTTEWFSAVHDGANGLLQVGTGAVAVQPGSGTGRALVGGALNTNATPVGNGADVTEDVLMTYSLPANSLTVNTRGVEIHAWGITANNTDTKTLKCYFGSTAIMTQALTVSIAGVWDVRATVLRTGAATEEAIATLASQGAAGIAMSTVIDTQPSADTTGAITINCTGQANATNANDIKQNGMTVMYIN